MFDPEKIAWLRNHFAIVAMGGVLLILLVLGLMRTPAGRGSLRALSRLAACRWAIAAPAAAVLVLRIALLGVWEIPRPSVLDEFSYLLQADTFASGRVVNPPHPHWQFFETMFVLQQPTYASVYPPAQGVFLAIGARFGHPWLGVWLSSGLMCLAIGWLLRGWLPPLWALLGTAWASVQLGLISYWMNSYWGGAVAATGGALLLGAACRIPRAFCVRDGFLFSLGLALLACSRPYEGLVLGLVSLTWLGWQVRGSTWTRARRTLLPAALVTGAGALALGWYCWRVTGDFLRLPAVEYMRQYAAAPVFVWQPPTPAPVYRHAELRSAHASLADDHQRFRTLSGAGEYTIWKLLRVGTFFLGPLIFLPLVMAHWLWRTRTRFLLAACVVTIAAVLMVAPLQPHYLAPIAGGIFALATQSIRMLWVAGRLGSAFGGIVSSAALPVVVLVMAISFLVEPPGTPLRQKPEIEDALKRAGGPQLVIVRYSAYHKLSEEWVYNAADIDAAPVVWARDMGDERNRELIRYYPDRRVWLLEADAAPMKLMEVKR